MRALRYSISVTLDGCCDRREIPASEDVHRHATESAWREPAPAGTRPAWMEPFARTIGAAGRRSP